MNLKHVCSEDELVLAQGHFQCRALVLAELNPVSVVRYVCSCIQATVLVTAKYGAVKSFEASDLARVMFRSHE
jgi:hypothetical protein